MLPAHTRFHPFAVQAHAAAILSTFREEFHREIYLVTLERAYFVSYLQLGLNTFLLVAFDWMTFRAGLWKENPGYRHAFIWRVGVLVVFGMYVLVYRRLRPATQEDVQRKHRVLGSAIVAWIIASGTWLSITNQYLISDVSIFAVSILAAAVAFPLPNRLRQLAYPVALVGLMLGIQVIGASPQASLSLLTNASGVVAVAYFLERLTQKRQMGALIDAKVIESERALSDRLLTNILPESVAERLRTSPGMIADGFTSASILFADVCGFTTLAAKMSPATLVRLLNALFSRLDALLDEHGVEKIKTIGDAYMVASGLPTASNDHAVRLASFALDLQQAVREFNDAEGVEITVRVGMNSGPVVAGVIGSKRLIYDLWGDTVNVASRMESHGVPGRIQVTEATATLLAGHFEFEAPTKLKVKGLGDMPAYLLIGRKGA